MLIIREYTKHSKQNYILRTLQDAVGTIGVFDGMHRGHRFLLDQVKEEATRRGCLSMVVTFAEHPRSVVETDYRPLLLTTLDEKLELIEAAGIDVCVVLDFSPLMAMRTSREFMELYLRDKMGVTCLVIGYDHHFGSDVQNGFQQYKLYGKELGIDVVRAKEFEGRDLHVSSSAVRRFLEDGNVDMARACLGRSYSLSGRVVEGHRVGRELGFPTANIEVDNPNKLLPARGAYAVYVYWDGEQHKGMLNIGSRPTLNNGEDTTVEVNIFDYDGDLYDKHLTVSFESRLRNEQKFDSLNELKLQLQQDAEAAKEILK